MKKLIGNKKEHFSLKCLQISDSCRIFAAENQKTKCMTSIVLDKETSNYWELIKSASNKAKLTLIALLSSSMAEDGVIIEKHKPLKARRLSRISDTDMEKEICGDPSPIVADEPDISKIVEGNKGRILNGLEKWL